MTTVTFGTGASIAGQRLSADRLPQRGGGMPARRDERALQPLSFRRPVRERRRTGALRGPVDGDDRFKPFGAPDRDDPSDMTVGRARRPLSAAMITHNASRY